MSDQNAKLRVLVVDNDRGFYDQFIEQLISTSDYDFIGCHSYLIHAMRTLQVSSIDILLLGEKLPDGDALLLLEWMKAMLGETSPKIVIVTREKTDISTRAAADYDVTARVDKSRGADHAARAIWDSLTTLRASA